MTQVAEDPLEAGRAAVVRGAYREAYELLRGRDGLEAADLEHVAEAAYWTGRLDESIELRERAYCAYVDAGEKTEAARVALWISQDYFGKAALAVSSGWFARAERLLDGVEESPAHGYLGFAKAANAMMAGELGGALDEIDAAIDVARRFGDRNLEAMATVVKGRGLVLSGRAEEGLKLLDEATAAAVSGELQAFATGFIYCCTITSCHGVGDYRRAAEWTEAANRWCDRNDLTGFPGACRVHHASITRLQGDWDAAEKQARLACDELQGFDAWTTSAGFYEIGEIHRRRGEFAEAEAAYDRAKEWSRDPQPGRALLRLAQGKADEAWEAISLSLGRVSDPVGRIRRLPAFVEIALATGNLRPAREAAEELERLADGFRVGGGRTPAFEAAVCQAWGEIRFAENDADGAVEELERAVRSWRDVGAPYETAQARMLLGLALRRRGQEAAARDEIRAARTQFERLGAVLDLQRAQELLGEASARRTFMFTDIVDSTKMVEAFGESKWKRALDWHDAELRARIEAEGGEVVKQTGDGYFAAFASPSDAIRAAVAIQRAIEERGIAPDVRIGIHTGGAFQRDGDDYVGQGVNVAARIGALAGAAEILVSRDSVDGSPFPLGEPRTETLKGIEQAVELVPVDWR